MLHACCKQTAAIEIKRRTCFLSPLLQVRPAVSDIKFRCNSKKKRSEVMREVFKVPVYLPNNIQRTAIVN